MRIIHLFADLCNLYGDYGNVCALKRALENKGQNVEIEYQSIDDEIDISGADFAVSYTHLTLPTILRV